MATRNFISGLAAAFSLGLASLTTAQIVQESVGDITFSLSVPEESASSGSGDIYFQVQAPTSYEWVALGQGSGMSGSNIFVVYTDSTGQNVTVSPRLGRGNVMPNYNSAAQIELLEGSGVSDGVMTANVRCSSCSSWDGGNMDFSASSASWIHAWLEGSPLDSDEQDATISRHSSASSFTWDLSSARNSENVNPFVAATGTTTSGDGESTGTSNSGSIPASCTPIAANSDNSNNSGDESGSSTADSNDASSTATGTTSTTTNTSDNGNDNDNDGTRGPPSWVTEGTAPPWATNGAKLIKRQSSSNGCPAGYEPSSASNTGSSSGSSSRGSVSSTLILAHAVLACLAFVALFPIGGILIRVANFTGLIWIHAAIQGLAYLLYIVAFGIGAWMASNLNYFTEAHPIIGVVLFIVLLGQPLFGLLHHKLFKKYGHRTLWSYVHIGIGRIAILLGIVNGGLGLQLRGTTGGGVIAYAVIAALMGLAYIGAITFGEVKRKRAAKATPYPSKGGEGPPSYANSEEMQQQGAPRYS